MGADLQKLMKVSKVLSTTSESLLPSDIINVMCQTRGRFDKKPPNTLLELRAELIHLKY